MEIKKDETNRGFGIYSFLDSNGEKCSIQESSRAFPPSIWFGISPDRMHLTQEEVAMLLPILKHFAENGELPRE